MYVTRIDLHNVRGVHRADQSMLYPDQSGGDRLDLPNINVLLGLNGGGKSTVLKAIALALSAHNRVIPQNHIIPVDMGSQKIHRHGPGQKTMTSQA